MTGELGDDEDESVDAETEFEEYDPSRRWVGNIWRRWRWRARVWAPVRGRGRGREVVGIMVVVERRSLGRE